MNGSVKLDETRRVWVGGLTRIDVQKVSVEIFFFVRHTFSQFQNIQTENKTKKDAVQRALELLAIIRTSENDKDVE